MPSLTRNIDVTPQSRADEGISPYIYRLYDLSKIIANEVTLLLNLNNRDVLRGYVHLFYDDVLHLSHFVSE